MPILHKLITGITLLAMFISPLHSQSPIENGCATNECCESVDYNDCNDCSDAYYGGARAAHWSAYVPIAVLIAAAIWLGFADKNGVRSSSSYSSHSASRSSTSTSFPFSGSTSTSTSSHTSTTTFSPSLTSTTTTSSRGLR